MIELAIAIVMIIFAIVLLAFGALLISIER